MPPAPPKKPDAAAKERNEYIPSYISKKPFYITSDSDAPTSTSTSDYLEHQRLQSASDTSAKWYERGAKLGPAATKFRKGACHNCGALTHATKACLSRPRKHGARWTGADIAADEVVADVKLGWDAKRDRWNGYDAREYAGVVDEYNALEALKRGGEGEGPAADGDLYEEEADMGRQQATSTRNLRLREDTAKYLLNLDLESAKYDPKTRSMVDAGATADTAAALVAEEGFMKASGDAAEFERAQRAAWEMQERGENSKLHLQANPTSGEYFAKKAKVEAETKKEAQKKALQEKYGGQEYVKDRTGENAVVESERFVEYDERGVVKGLVGKKAKSQYPEDVLINNHTSVWGSWWHNFVWGYACCHSTVKNSYCTGEDGVKAFEEADRLKAEEDAAVEEVPKQIAWKEEAGQEEHVPNAVDDDRKATKDSAARKRTREEMISGMTEEDMDEMRRKRANKGDPMASLLGKDELVN